MPGPFIPSSAPMPGLGDPVPYGGAIASTGLGALVSIAGGLILANQQEKSNLELARYQAEANERYLQQQLEYNTPKNQMARFLEAGLNPNLIYGQGTPGNQSAPLTYPDIGRVDQRLITSLIPLVNQTRMVESQVQATDALTRQRTVLAELNKLQKDVLARNPALNDEAYNAMIESLKSAAAIKANDAAAGRAQWQQRTEKWEQDGQIVIGTPGQRKLFEELRLLDQRFKLSGLDEEIRTEVLTGKEFQNAILDVQRRWLTDGDITPQHIYQLLQVILLKSLSR